MNEPDTTMTPTALSGKPAPPPAPADNVKVKKSLADIAAGKKTLAQIAEEILGGGE